MRGKFTERIICLSLCVFLVFGAFVPRKAHAAIAIDDAAIIMLMLAAAGITFTSQDYVEDVVDGFLGASGGSYDGLLSDLKSSYTLLNGVPVIPVPTRLASSLRSLMADLFDYFTVDAGRQGSVNLTVSVPGSFSNAALATDPAILETFNLSFVSSNAPIYVVCCYDPPVYYPDGSLQYKRNGIRYRLFSLGSFSGTYTYGGSDDKIIVSERTQFEDDCPLGVQHSVWEGGLYTSDRYSEFSSVFGLPSSALPLGTSSYVADDPSIIPIISVLLHGLSGVTDVTVPYGLTFPETLTAPDVLDNFEQRLEEGAGDEAMVFPVSGVIDSTLPWQQAQEEYLVNVNDLTVPEEGTLTDVTSYLNKVLTSVKALPAAISAAVIGTGSLNFDGFKGLSLANVFPFCIPFDLKNALLAFNAPPADPVWEISFAGTFMEPAGSIVLDMKQFESLFKIVRFFIYGGFVVSLILLTRRIIKG